MDIIIYLEQLDITFMKTRPLNPLSPDSDKHLNSPYNFRT